MTSSCGAAAVRNHRTSGSNRSGVGIECLMAMSGLLAAAVIVAELTL